jgi:hypothetical protein
MAVPKSVRDLEPSAIVVAGVPAVVAVVVAALLPLPRPLQSGAAIVVWLALLFPWLDYLKD